jgi:hypothetical protein
MPQDYYSSLASLVRSSACDDAPKRGAIYALARSELRQFLARQKADRSARNQELHALESAIQRIEFELTQPSERTLPVAPSIEILPPEHPQPDLSKLHSEPTISRRPPTTYFLLSFIGAVILVIVTYLVVERGLHDNSNSSSAVSATPNTVDAHESIPQHTLTTDFPIPTTYGVYAANDSHLIELTPLSIKIPNRLVPIAIALQSASAAKLPNGRAQFVVFRRDMANNAPEKVYVRRIAPLAQGRPGEGDTWTLTDISYDMKVSPLEGNLAMILVRPAAANFVFPVGRYALVIRSTAYDFSVEADARSGAQ